MNNEIKSLKDLRQRKQQIEREIETYREKLSVNSFALNFLRTKSRNSSLCAESLKESSLTGLYKFAVNAKRVLDIARLGISVYKDYKK